MLLHKPWFTLELQELGCCFCTADEETGAVSSGFLTGNGIATGASGISLSTVVGTDTGGVVVIGTIVGVDNGVVDGLLNKTKYATAQITTTTGRTIYKILPEDAPSPPNKLIESLNDICIYKVI